MTASPYLIDSHCHIHDRSVYEFALSRQKKQTTEEFTPEKIFERMNKNNIKTAICIGTTHEDSLSARDFAKKHDNVYWSYGIHPEETNNVSLSAISKCLKGPFAGHTECGSASLSAEKSMADRPLGRGKPEGLIDFSDAVQERALQTLTSSQKLVAIGEVGLDYHSDAYDRDSQIMLFEQMLDLAVKAELPLIFHIRNAFDDFFAVLDNFRSKKIRGVVHSFSDSKDNLEKSLNRDLYIGVNGLATFTNIPLPPLERTLLETDSPFLAPIPFRGKVNDPSHIKDIADFLAKKHNIPFDDVAIITTQNTETLFALNTNLRYNIPHECK